MKLNWKLYLGLVAISASMFVQCKSESGAEAPLMAVFNTTKGEVSVELTYKQTPITVSNFIALATGKMKNEIKEGPYYDKTAILQVYDKKIIQAGDPTGSGAGNVKYTFHNEFNDSLNFNTPGKLAVLNNRGTDMTNTSQFFFTVAADPQLNNRYPIFGKVIAGMEVLDSIKRGDSIFSVDILAKNAEATAFMQAAPAKMIAYVDSIKELKSARVKEELAKYEAYKKEGYKEVNGMFLYKKTKTNKRGKKMKKGDNIKVHYRGKLLNGHEFDSSYKRNQPFELPIGEGRVIKGWEEGIPMFRKGEKGTLVIKPEAAYGDTEIPGIPANSVLVFDIEVLDIKAKK